MLQALLNAAPDVQRCSLPCLWVHLLLAVCMLALVAIPRPPLYLLLLLLRSKSGPSKSCVPVERPLSHACILLKLLVQASCTATQRRAPCWVRRSPAAIHCQLLGMHACMHSGCSNRHHSPGYSIRGGPCQRETMRPHLGRGQRLQTALHAVHDVSRMLPDIIA